MDLRILGARTETELLDAVVARLEALNESGVFATCDDRDEEDEGQCASHDETLPGTLEALQVDIETARRRIADARQPGHGIEVLQREMRNMPPRIYGNVIRDTRA